MCELLSVILRKYADAAYPKGGSECSQSARESLLVSSDRLLANWDGASQTTQMNKRLRTMAKSAIKYYTQSLTLEEDLPADRRREYLLSVFSGEAIDEAGYHQALDQDRLT
jgi:hypothetical protein